MVCITLHRSRAAGYKALSRRLGGFRAAFDRVGATKWDAFRTKFREPETRREAPAPAPNRSMAWIAAVFRAGSFASPR